MEKWVVGRLEAKTSKNALFLRFKVCSKNGGECKRLHLRLGGWEVVKIFGNAFINFSKNEYHYIVFQFYDITILLINFIIL